MVKYEAPRNAGDDRPKIERLVLYPTSPVQAETKKGQEPPMRAIGRSIIGASKLFEPSWKVIRRAGFNPLPPFLAHLSFLDLRQAGFRSSGLVMDMLKDTYEGSAMFEELPCRVDRGGLLVSDTVSGSEGVPASKLTVPITNLDGAIGWERQAIAEMLGLNSRGDVAFLTLATCERSPGSQAQIEDVATQIYDQNLLPEEIVLAPVREAPRRNVAAN